MWHTNMRTDTLSVLEWGYGSCVASRILIFLGSSGGWLTSYIKYFCFSGNVKKQKVSNGFFIENVKGKGAKWFQNPTKEV